MPSKTLTGTLADAVDGTEYGVELALFAEAPREDDPFDPSDPVHIVVDAAEMFLDLRSHRNVNLQTDRDFVLRAPKVVAGKGGHIWIYGSGTVTMHSDWDIVGDNQRTAMSVPVLIPYYPTTENDVKGSLLRSEL